MAIAFPFAVKALDRKAGDSVYAAGVGFVWTGLPYELAVMPSGKMEVPVPDGGIARYRLLSEMALAWGEDGECALAECYVERIRWRGGPFGVGTFLGVAYFIPGRDYAVNSAFGMTVGVVLEKEGTADYGPHSRIRFSYMLLDGGTVVLYPSGALLWVF